jgi:hypothetical protein
MSKYQSFFALSLALSAILVVSFTLLSSYSSLANAQQQNNDNKTLMQPQVVQSMTTTNASKMNIVLVHGAWADGSS